MANSRRRWAKGDEGVTLMEVLVASAIGVIISGLLILVWIALSDSWTVTARGSEARDFARDAVARMSREIRDMEPRVGQATAILVAEASRIRFSTTFNVSGNQSATLPPVLTEYRYVPGTGDSQGVLYWIRDTNGNGAIDGGDRDRIVATHLLNDDGRPMFTYTYLDGQAARQQSTTIPEADLHTVQVVEIRVVVDMQPGRAPDPMDLASSVQLRNQQ